MKPKFYPVILVVYTEAGPRFKVAHNGDEYDSFCSQYVGPDSRLEMIKPVYAQYNEWNENKWEISEDKNGNT